jgi:hypothetical protein
MQLHSAVLWAFICFAVHVSARNVYAHYMVGISDEIVSVVTNISCAQFGTVSEGHAQIDVEDTIELGSVILSMVY